MPDEVQAAFRRIIASANAIMEATAPASVSANWYKTPTQSSDHKTWSDIQPSFQQDDDLEEILFHDGVSRSVSCKLGETVRRSLTSLEVELRAALDDVWAKIICLPGSSNTSLVHLRMQMCQVYESIYNRKRSAWIEDIRRLVLERLDKARPTGKTKLDAEVTRSKEEDKHAFKQIYVPVLEACFAKNPTPSRADKLLLAEKTGMSYRQIHVWFQNRRSRSKKVNINSVPKGPNCETLDVQDTLSLPPVTPVGSNPNAGAVLSSASLEHAFPIQYPPTVEADPFPCRFGDLSCFPKINWARRPATELPKICELDMNALCSAFASLRITDAARSVLQKRGKRAQKGTDIPSKMSCDAYPPFVVRPLCAPLFSLLRNAAPRASRRSEPPSCDENEPAKAASTPSDANGLQSASRKSRTRKCGGKELSSAASGPVSVKRRSRKAGPANTQARIKRSEKYSASQRTTRASTSERRKGKEVSVQPAVQSPEPPSSRPSPTPSIESLPSLSYSSGSSPSSTYSQSPPSSFSTLSDDGHSPPHDAYQSTDYSLTLPTLQTAYDDYPSSTSAFGGFSFDLVKGPLDHSLNFGLPEYPSYSDTFDSLSQGLQSSSDFAPLLSLELPPLAS